MKLFIASGQDNKQEEVDPNALEREVEYDEEEESPDDEDEFEEDDEDDAELDISSASDDEYRKYYKILDMVRGGRSGRVSTSVGRGSRRMGSASPSTPVVPTTGTTSSSTPVVPATGTASPTTPVASPFPSQSPTNVESHHPAADEKGPQLPGHQPCWISGGKIDPGSASCYITTLVHAHILGPMDSWKEFPPSVRELLFDMYVFTRPEDLPRARVVWESTAQTNFRKSMWEARDKAMKTTSSRDPTTWLDYGPVWLRRDYWESLCHRWATGPWQERSQAAKRNRPAHPEKNVHTSGSISYATHSQKLRHELERAPTFCKLFDGTHKRKGTDDYVSESARMIAETYDRTLADHYAEGTPQPHLGPEAWVDAAEGPSARLWGQPGYYSSVVLICEFGRSSGLCEFICCAARQWWRGHEKPHPGRATAAV
ncbi:hypothetical protein Taro_038661 [Colocasia esculenta]|uniref:Uncharacterized protein n=1 Tax=Colocasia esculenta TaxID=4460 RepID=A0A843WMV8_COLES|nr:hypothetical protein [Colocasia esculenta]